MYNSTDSNKLQHPFREQCSRLYKLGLSILPLRFREKLAACKWKDLQTTRLTPDEIKSWCNKRLASTDVDIPFNIGIITGKLSGVVVVDADDDEAVKYVNEHLPYTPIQVTSRKGCHFYYRYPTEGLVKNFQGGTLNGQKIDIRGEGGLTVGPGSVHQTGFVYQFSGDWAKWSEMPSYNPAWLTPDKPIRTVNPEAVATWVIDTDDDCDVDIDERLTTWRKLLANSPGSRQGGAIKYTFALAMAGIHGCCLSVEEALPEFTRWGTKSSNQDSFGGYYPWTEAELLGKLEGALTTQPDKPRGWLLPVSEDRLAAALGIDAPAPTAPQNAEAPIEAPAPKPAERKRRGYRLDELDLLPEAEFLIHDHLTARGCNVIYGPSGSYKSFLAVDMALSIATGRKFLGMYQVTQGNVAYICSEGSAGIKKRTNAWLKFHGFTKKPRNIIVIPHAFDLMQEEEADAIRDIIRTDLEAPPDLIVFDTLARNFGGDENSTEDMNSYVKITDYFSNVAARLHVHHSGWGEKNRERGSSVLRGAADTILATDKQSDGRVILSCRKAKDSEPFEPYYLSSNVIDLPDSKKSLVFEFDGLEHDQPEIDAINHRDAIVAILQQHPSGLTSQDIKKQLKIGRDQCYTLIAELKKDGILIFNPTTKKTCLRS